MSERLDEGAVDDVDGDDDDDGDDNDDDDEDDDDDDDDEVDSSSESSMRNGHSSSGPYLCDCREGREKRHRFQPCVGVCKNGT